MSIAQEYEEGKTLRQLARLHRKSPKTIARDLRAEGVELRHGGANRSEIRNASKAVRDLDAILGVEYRHAVKKAGLSANWWRTIRRGLYSPTVANFEAVVNAAGYELVLRRKLT